MRRIGNQGSCRPFGALSHGGFFRRLTAPATSWRPFGARRGFTLLEVLATLVLVGIILPAVMHGISLATIAAGEAKHKVEAVSLAQTKLAELTADFQTLNQPGASSGSLISRCQSTLWHFGR